MNYRRLIVQSLVAVTLFAALRAVSAADPMKSLRHAESFSFGGIGVAGTPSEGEVAFRELIARKYALKDFHKLLKSGDPEGQCYALVGIRKLQPKAFPNFAEKFRNDRTKVKTIGGCMISEQPMSSVVAGIAKGNYDAAVNRRLQP